MADAEVLLRRAAVEQRLGLRKSTIYSMMVRAGPRRKGRSGPLGKWARSARAVSRAMAPRGVHPARLDAAPSGPSQKSTFPR